MTILTKTFNPMTNLVQSKVLFLKNQFFKILIILLFPFVVLSNPPGTCPAGSGNIGGNVFKDLNFNGISDDAAGGYLGVIVDIYETNASGTTVLLSNTTTDASGNYYFSGLTDGKRYQIRFSTPASLSSLKPTFKGSGSNTLTTYATSPSCSVNLGMASPNQYCDPNASIFMTCYVNGDPIAAGNNLGDSTAIVAVPFGVTATNGANKVIAKLKDVGACWGETYSRTKKTIISAAVMRRHSGYGPKGTGGLYFINYSNPASPTITGSIDLSVLGVAIGTDPRIADPLPNNITMANHDTAAYRLTGKFGIGGIAISEDDKTLALVSLSTKELILIDLTNFNATGAMPSSSNVTKVALPNPTCIGGEFRPWAVTYYNGSVYIGGVCDASTSKVQTDLKAFVYKYDGATSFTQVLSYSLDYKRGKVFFLSPIDKWQPWTDNYLTAYDSNLGGFCYPQPILSDLAFDVDGSLVMGFADRMGMQGGYKNFVPNKSNTTDLALTFSGGDVIKACNIGGTLILEGATSCTTTGGAANMQGPGGNEFYFQDNWFNVHEEITSGGVIVKPGTNQVAVTCIDPIIDFSSGLIWFDMTTGARTKSYEVIPKSTNPATTSAGGKANGLGDAQLQITSAPLQIGNYLWADCNQNGLQDPNELPLVGVNVSLYDKAGSLKATVQTNASGEYYFQKGVGNIDTIFPDTIYYVVVGNGGQFSNNLLTLAGINYTLTAANKPNNEINSDGTIGGSSDPAFTFGLPFVKVQTASVTRHDIDFGFYNSSLVLNSIVLEHETCPGANDGRIVINASIPNAPIFYSTDGGVSYVTNNVFSNLAPGSYNIKIKSTDVPGSCSGVIDTTVMIIAGQPTPAPSVTNYEICQNAGVPGGGGLRAACAPCAPGQNQNLTWWTAATGGTQVSAGQPFDPVFAGLVNASVPGEYKFYAQCSCNTCLSPRVEAIFYVRPLPTPVIVGDTLVCQNSTTTYSTALVNGSTYVWSLATGGTIVATNNNSIKIKWTAATGSGPHMVTVTETSIYGCKTTKTFLVKIREVILICQNILHVSLDADCKSKITTGDIIGTTIPGSQSDSIVLFIGNRILEKGIGFIIVDGIDIKGNSYDLVGKKYSVSIIEPCLGNSCWGSILFEDKLAPIIKCPADVSVSCVEASINGVPTSISGIPTILKECSTYTTGFEDQEFDADCANPFTEAPAGFPTSVSFNPTIAGNNTAKLIVRTFTVKDSGGYSTTCQQVIYVKKGNLSNVICPKDITLSCATSVTDSSTTGSPFYDIDGDPKTTYDQSPLKTGTCNFNASYVDQIIPICTGSYKIVRTWTIVDWCAPTNFNTKNCAQLIKLLDDTKPIVRAEYIDYLDDQTTSEVDFSPVNRNITFGNTPVDYYPSGSPSLCGGVFNIKLIAKNQGCANGAVDITTNNNHISIKSKNFNPSTLETTYIFESHFDQIGDYEVIFSATNDCGYGATSQTFNIHVVDNVRPSMACDRITQVALTNNDPARLLANAVDDGTNDNCELDYMLIRRMTVCDGNGDQITNTIDDFYPIIDFNCCDMDDTITVQLRAWDKAGNFNDCMVQVYVEDKVRPTCIPPVDVTISCKDLDRLNTFGNPTIGDNCAFDTIYKEILNLDNCKKNFVTRSWTVKEKYGYKNETTCSQKLAVLTKTDFIVDFPDDVTVNCAADLDNGGIADTLDMLLRSPNQDGNIQNLGCGVIAVNVHDDIFNSEPGVCYKILRTYSVIDWCTYDVNKGGSCTGNYAPGVTERGNQKGRIFRENSDSDKLDGILCFTQLIKIIDNIKPEITGCPTTKELVYDMSNEDDGNGYSCDGIYKYTATATDQCSASKTTQNLKFNWFIYSNSDLNKIVKSGTGATLVEKRNGRVETGVELPYDTTYRIKWIVEDACGNTAVCEYDFTILDAKRPTVICKNIAAELMKVDINNDGINDGGRVEVWASEFLASAKDNCTLTSNLKFGVRRSGTGTGFPRLPNGAPQNSVEFTCPDLGVNLVEVWVIDASGNADYCEAQITIQDNLNSACTIPLAAALNGTISNEINENVQNVQVNLNAWNGVPVSKFMTSVSGTYNFSKLYGGANYKVSAEKNDDYLNGVTTKDISDINAHILGNRYLNSPYKLIAADVNKSGNITSLDLLEIRKLILKKSIKFTNNTSWRFFDKSFVFVDPTQPFDIDVPEVMKLDSIHGDNTQDFMAIKVGDVNYSASTSNLLGAIVRSENQSTYIMTNDVELTNDTYTTIPFHIESQINSLQFTLNTSQNINIVQVIPNEKAGFTAANFAAHNNAITISWNGINPSGQKLFDIVVSSKKTALLSELVSIGGNITSIEAYGDDNKPYDVKMKFGKKVMNSTFELFQNVPNPFDQSTIIGFNLPESSEALIKIMSADGKLVKMINGKYSKGYNSVQIKKDEIGSSGVFYYQIETNSTSATKKLIITE